MRFSQRSGHAPTRVEFQRTEVDDALRAKLWSALYIISSEISGAEYQRHGLAKEQIGKRLWLFHYRQPMDRYSGGGISGVLNAYRQEFFLGKWYEVYDLVEAVARELTGDLAESFTKIVNSFLTEELSAYRLIDGHIVEITTDEERQAIEQAVADAQPLAGVYSHLSDAIAKISDRHNPDYRNSIKESISAVEAMCQAITCDRSATLGEALKRLEHAGVSLHGSLKSGWLKLYGYTSDAGGIRHALSEKPSISFADAKYMLVSCSAFISYLAEASGAAGIVLEPPA